MQKKVNDENLITHDDFLSVSRRCYYNGFIAEFYERFAEENHMPIRLSSDGEIIYGKNLEFLRKAKNVRECSKSWTFDYFKKSGYKNLIRVDRCKDRFCLNCQALEADQRFLQYSPLLDSYADEYDLYHVVLTVPNVDSENLANTITLMLDKFSYLIRFFDGRKKIRDIDFEKYGYQGAVRSLEITVSKRNGTFHPHLHCMFILEKDLDMPQVYWNRFSDDRTGRQPTRLYSEFEVLLQRMWCLLILKIKVTKANIEQIGAVCDYPDGFSCRADLSNGKYHEIFKYAIKGSFKNETLFEYKAFLTLYTALFGRRCYQTFGCLLKYDFNDVDGDLGLTSPDEAFDMFLSRLEMEELPRRVQEVLSEILKSTKKEEFKYISKATFARHFKALSEEEKLYVLKELSQ